MKIKNVGTVKRYTLVNRTKLFFSSIKKEKGITLVALVITIVVILILAGVSIANLTGKNGILSKVETVEKKNIEAQMLENLRLKIIEVQTDKIDEKATLVDLVEVLSNDSQNEYIITLEDGKINGTIPIITKETEKIYVICENYEFEVNKKLEITYVGKSSVSADNGVYENVKVSPSTICANDEYPRESSKFCF